MKKILVFLMLLIGSCTTYSQEEEYIGPPYTAVSIYELLGGGAKYDGWAISVTGYLKFYDGMDAAYLYPSKHAYLLGDTASCILLDLRNSSNNVQKNELNKFSGKYVDVGGRYTYLGRHELKGLDASVGPSYASAIDDINYILINNGSEYLD